MDVCKCIAPSRYRGTLNSRRAASPLVRLEEGEKRLEPQVQDYVEVRNPQSTVQLLEVLDKFEERYSYKAVKGSRNSDNVERRGWNECRMSKVDNNRRNWRTEDVRRPSNGKNDYRGNY
ncbi:uncharacterized protein TNCV_3298331 [Trichonephila clavipes]|uniref:Uncharacterized protein n=1 Tax=Trichonephila clavipes TaxID=2585209 RepID=A0A8X6VTJ7_TRICX|nr:uncharacterized protein TNCV_3298331 [Trichonephila clavipes]